MKDRTGLFSNLFKSGFMRSVFTRALAILIVISCVIAAVAFISFTDEIRRSILSDRQKQLIAVEQTVSRRMEEITSIAYNIGADPAFYFEPVTGQTASGREMSAMLKRYLVGNNFIEHLAYCRVSESDTIYTSRGERSLSEFFNTALGMPKEAAEQIVEAIYRENNVRIGLFGEGDSAYFSYNYPLPQFSAKPKAHVLTMVPVKKVRQLLESLLINENGQASVFDVQGEKLYGVGNPDDGVDLTAFLTSASPEENVTSASGEKYVLQKVVSETNGWTYVSVLRHSDTLTGLANKQLAFIAFVLIVLVAAILVILGIIVKQYRPISNLATQVAGKQKDADGKFVDEREFLSNTIAALSDDSEQKQKYETAYYEAEAANRAKSAFLSSVSHDIRTPMNAIIGMTAIARKHIGDPAYVDDCLKKVQASSEYLLDIINNVLDMSRIESGRIPIAEETVLIPALIDSVVSLMTSSVEAKSQKLAVDMSGLRQTAVVGDNIHIVQVFVNILSNAVKFTPPGGSITLTASQSESDDPQFGHYVFSFADTGVGIPPEFIGHVFDTFSRAKISSGAEGTGLGMAIAKKLVELMGGTIACQSEMGRGATFTVKLRMRYADPADAPSGAAASDNPPAALGQDAVVDLTGKRILLVEDNAMNREIARKIIAETGARVDDANDGKEAVETFAGHPPGYYDLILMDIQMPVMNGYEATARIRSMDRADAQTVLIYAMTANTFDEDVRQVLDAGMNGHIGKPYHPQTLYQTLSKALERGGGQPS